MDGPDLTDPATLAAFRAGNREVLANVYRAHREAVLELLKQGFGFSSKGERIRFRGFREPFEIQEVLQDGFLQAFRDSARKAYDPARPYRPYLITIVRNLVIDRFRRQSLERSLFVAIGAGESETDEDAIDRASLHSSASESRLSPELQAFQNELAAVLQMFLTTLDSVDQRILQEHLMGEMSQAAIADALDTDRNDIRKRIRDMRQALLRHLKREGVINELDPSEIFKIMLIIAFG